MQCLFYVYKAYNLSVYQKSGFSLSGDRILKRSGPWQKASKAGRSDCSFNLLFYTEILATL